MIELFFTGFLVVVTYLLLVNMLAVLKSRNLKIYLRQVASFIPVQNSFDSIMDSLYFEDEAFSTKVSVSRNGIYLRALFKFSAVVPWERITAIRVVDLNGSLVANLRVSIDGKIDRRLTIPWKKGFSESVPDNIAMIHG